MGGWNSEAANAGGASTARHRSFSASRSLNAGGGGSEASWRSAIKPVKDAAARGQNSNDALQAAVRKFLDACELGFPSLGDAANKELASDVLLLVRAINRPPQPSDEGSGGGGSGAGSGSGSGDSSAAATRSIGDGFNALLGDLLTSQKIALDAEVVTTLAAYYRAQLNPPRSGAAEGSWAGPT